MKEIIEIFKILFEESSFLGKFFITIGSPILLIIMLFLMWIGMAQND